MGATIAIRMAALHPELCKGLFLISLLPPVEVRLDFLRGMHALGEATRDER